MDNWNPRYTAYATAHGKSEISMIEEDHSRYPGGVMTGFIVWINNKWAEWKSNKRIRGNYILSNKDHDEFDSWLTSQSNNRQIKQGRLFPQNER